MCVNFWSYVFFTVRYADGLTQKNLIFEQESDQGCNIFTTSTQKNCKTLKLKHLWTIKEPGLGFILVAERGMDFYKTRNFSDTSPEIDLDYAAARPSGPQFDCLSRAVSTPTSCSLTYQYHHRRGSGPWKYLGYSSYPWGGCRWKLKCI